MSSYGQLILGKYMAALTGKEPQQDVQPKWLGDLELDLYWPDYDLAVEFQGEGHFAPVFGTKAFRRQQINDRRKLQLCEEQGIVLIRLEVMDLRHPNIPEVMLRRFIQCYGRYAGPRRYFTICGENPITRPILFDFNRSFEDYRRGRQNWFGKQDRSGNAKMHRRLKRALGT